MDDMWSLLYTLVELAEGQLPWRQLVDPEEIAVKKRSARYEDMIRYVQPASYRCTILSVLENYLLEPRIS